MRLNLGMINSWDEGGFKDCHDRGLHHVEFTVNYYCDANAFAASVPDMLEWSKKYDVKVSSMGRWGEQIQNEDGTLNEELFKNHLTLIEAAGKLGCPVYNCGINYADKRTFTQNCAFAIEQLRKLVEFGKEHNVKIAVYNCSWYNFIYDEQTWQIILPAVPGLGIKYDISHCLERGADNDFMKEMADWGEYFYHFHLKGCMYVDKQHYDDPPIGLDDVNWGAVFGMLYIKEYRGMVSIEPHSGYWQGGKGSWGVGFSIKYAQQFLMPDGYEE